MADPITHLFKGTQTDGTVTVQSFITLCCKKHVLGLDGLGTVDPEACTCPDLESSDSGSDS